jgi:hypothetical protein
MFEHFSLIHWLSGLSYGLLAFSYALRSIKWLRIVAVGGCVIDLVVYYAIRPGQPMWLQLGFTTVIILINLYQLFVLYRESRPIDFSYEARFLHRQVFAGLSTGEFNKLLQAGRFDTAQPGTQITRKDMPVETLYVLLSGEMDVRVDDTVVARMVRAGTLIGDMGYITGMPASADVVVQTPSRVFMLPVKTMDRLQSERPELHIKLTGILSGGMADKLRRADAHFVSRFPQQAEPG